MTTPSYSFPCKAYYNTVFSGLIKCVVISGKKDNNNIPDCSTSSHLKIKITSKTTTGYFFGEIVDASGLDVFPRKAYHKTGMFRFRVDDYRWEY